jgi:hypothetical protein
MNVQIPCAVAASSLILAVVSTACSKDLTYQVTALHPDANYPMTRDPGDAAQLTDGKINHFPFWTQRDSVGWQQRTPVRLSLESNLETGLNYRLTIRTANRDRAGVHPPRRIDVYCGVIGNHRHVAQLIPQPDQLRRDGVVDLDLIIPGCTSGALDVILHSQGQYLMLDEITLMPSRGKVLLTQATVEAVADPVNDSRAKLEMSLRGQAVPSPHHHVRAWLAEPWGDLGVRGPETRVDLLSLPWSSSFYVIGMRNGDHRAQRHTLVLDSGGTKHATVYRLHQVLSADGARVLDALVPETDRSWEIPAGESFYLMIQESPVVGSGERTHRIIEASGRETQLRVNIRQLDHIRPTSEDRPTSTLGAIPLTSRSGRQLTQSDS